MSLSVNIRRKRFAIVRFFKVQPGVLRCAAPFLFLAFLPDPPSSPSGPPLRPPARPAPPPPVPLPPSARAPTGPPRSIPSRFPPAAPLAPPCPPPAPSAHRPPPSARSPSLRPPALSPFCAAAPFSGSNIDPDISPWFFFLPSYARHFQAFVLPFPPCSQKKLYSSISRIKYYLLFELARTYAGRVSLPLPILRMANIAGAPVLSARQCE